jgi:hypothetical protein
MPRHFKQTHYKSFQRQLHIYGFQRIAGKGMRDNGAYYHETFIHGEKQLSLCMVRQKIKGLDAYHTLSHKDPDFYAPQQEARQTAVTTTTASPTTTKLESSRLQMIGSERGIIDRVVWSKPRAIQTGCSNLEWVQPPNKILASHDTYSPAIKDLRSPMLVKSSTVGTASLSEGAAAAMEEAEEMFFAGKRFFFVEPLEETPEKLEETPKRKTKRWRRSSWTARGDWGSALTISTF